MASEPLGSLSALDGALDRALARWKRPGPPFALLLSGGVDSSLLAWELRGTDRLTTVTVGLAGAPDLRYGGSAARELAVRWEGRTVSENDLRQTAERVRPNLAAVREGFRPILLALAVALEASPAGPVLCGQGVDELFLGYAHFRGLGLAEAGRLAENDLERLRQEDEPASVALAEALGRELVAPYLASEFVDAARSIPLAQRLPAGHPKEAFRRWAVRRGLPPAIAGRPKRAFQYGTRVDRWWKRHGRASLAR